MNLHKSYNFVVVKTPDFDAYCRSFCRSHRLSSPPRRSIQFRLIFAIIRLCSRGNATPGKMRRNQFVSTLTSRSNVAWNDLSGAEQWAVRQTIDWTWRREGSRVGRELSGSPLGWRRPCWIGNERRHDRLSILPPPGPGTNSFSISAGVHHFPRR